MAWIPPWLLMVSSGVHRSIACGLLQSGRAVPAVPETIAFHMHRLINWYLKLKFSHSWLPPSLLFIEYMLCNVHFPVWSSLQPSGVHATHVLHIRIMRQAEGLSMENDRPGIWTQGSPPSKSVFFHYINPLCFRLYTNLLRLFCGNILSWFILIACWHWSSYPSWTHVTCRNVQDTVGSPIGSRRGIRGTDLFQKVRKYNNSPKWWTERHCWGSGTEGS